MRSVMVYVQHLLGTGHLVRAKLLAEALARHGFDTHLVSGGVPNGSGPPRGVRIVQLPPIRVADATFTPLRDASSDPIDNAFRERRRDLLLAAYDAVRPAAVLFETFPFGRRAMRFELLPLLERIDATRPRPLVIASVREILQRRHRERERETLTCAGRWFDAILVHGDRRFARFEDTFALAGELAPPVHYTGFVLERPMTQRREDRTRDEVLVSAGGGAVGCELLGAAIAARPRSRLRDLTWRVLAGPNVSEADFQRLRASAANAVVERSRGDFADLLRSAFVSVSQAGYNTVLDVVTSGARPVIVPFGGNGETEQRVRGERLRDLGLAVVVDDRTLSAEVLAGAVDEAATRPDFARWDFDSDGATRTAELVRSMLASDTVRRARPAA